MTPTLNWFREASLLTWCTFVPTCKTIFYSFVTDPNKLLLARSPSMRIFSGSTYESRSRFPRGVRYLYLRSPVHQLFQQWALTSVGQDLIFEVKCSFGFPFVVTAAYLRYVGERSIWNDIERWARYKGASLVNIPFIEIGSKPWIAGYGRRNTSAWSLLSRGLEMRTVYFAKMRSVRVTKVGADNSLAAVAPGPVHRIEATFSCSFTL